MFARFSVYLLLIFAFFCEIQSVFAQNQWKTCDCDIPINYRICESGRDYQVKCVFEIPASIDKCADIFCNAENHTKWVFNCIESADIQKTDSSGIFRNIIKAPFFMSDREVFVEYKIEKNSDNSITISNNCLPDYRPHNDKYERITRYKSTYKFVSNGNNTTVHYFTETGGPKNLSDFMLYFFLCKSTEETIENLKKIVGK